MYKLLTVTMQDEEEARDTVDRMAHSGVYSPVRVTRSGNVVSVDIGNPLIAGMFEAAGLISKFFRECVIRRTCYRRYVSHASS